MVGTGSVWPGYGPSVVVLVGCLFTPGPVTRHRWGGGAWQETQNPSLLGLLAVVCCCCTFVASSFAYVEKLHSADVLLQIVVCRIMDSINLHFFFFQKIS